jgi:hypothetical protein
VANYIGSCFGESYGNGSSEAGGRSRDQRGLARKIEEIIGHDYFLLASSPDPEPLNSG